MIFLEGGKLAPAQSPAEKARVLSQGVLNFLSRKHTSRHFRSVVQRGLACRACEQWALYRYLITHTSSSSAAAAAATAFNRSQNN